MAKKKKKGKVFLIDGNSFCYRAFFAIRGLSTSRGEPTNAIYGVINMLKKILNAENPDYMAVCFDRKEPTFRHEKYKDYKAHRKPMPDELLEQVPHIKELIEAYNIPIYEKAGYEADDILGTMASQIAEKGFEVYIVTSDKDALQLVGGKVKIYNPHKDGIIYDEKAVKEKLDGIGPEKVIDLMALMGDSSDNIPGVPKIGEKTGIQLLKEFGSVAGIYENLGKIKSESRRKTLEENKNVAELSRELATIDTNIPVEFDIEDMKVESPDDEKLLELLRKFEFRTLIKDVTPTAVEEEEKRDYFLIKNEKELKSLIGKIKKSGKVAVDTETTSEKPFLAELVGLSFSVKEREAYYIPCSSDKHSGKGIDSSIALDALKDVLEDTKIEKYGQNIKYDYLVLFSCGVRLKGLKFDTMVASYLLTPNKFNHNLDDISFNYLGVTKITLESLIGKGRARITMDKVDPEKVKDYAAEDADCVFRLVKVLGKKLKSDNLENLFYDMEMPLIEVLAKVELNGVKLDVPFLKGLSEMFEADLLVLEKKIYKEAGGEFNVNSPKQLSKVLFEDLKIPPLKKTKTGYSTDGGVLEKLAEEYELPHLVLQHRERSKLKSTYVDALPQLVNPETGLIHTSFNQTVTATGRLSSSEPNLQNIPIKTELGREIRKAFIPRSKNRKILAADYSQIELRLLAHFSEDEKLLSAFEKDADIHNFTATLLYGCKEADVTREMRDVAKTVNFSVIYGKTPYGLSRDLNIPVDEAHAFIRSYFERYSGVREYLDSQKEKARKNKFLTTLLGRRAYFPDIRSSDVTVRQFAERAAINAPLQGSAADLIKLAMIAIQEKLEGEGLESLMIIQVHDELVFDVLSTEMEKVKDIVRREMENVYKLKVPLVATIKDGNNWYECGK